MRHLIPISGKDSLATALFQSAYEPRDYEFFYNDNGSELPETYQWLDSVEESTGWKITRIGSDLEEIIDGFDFLPGQNSRYCTRMSKIEPMDNWVGGDSAIVYYGLRADEGRVGYVKNKADITPKYPLKEHGIDLNGVWAIVSAKGLLPPSFEWPALREAVFGKLDTNDISFLTPWERHIIFSGRSRPNCYFCFYQRQYEFAWLYDTHPDLFEKACKMEEKTGGEGYTWREGYYLRDKIINERDRILNERAKQVVEIIMKRRNGELFPFEDNMLAATSCGLLCGK